MLNCYLYEGTAQFEHLKKKGENISCAAEELALQGLIDLLSKYRLGNNRSEIFAWSDIAMIFSCCGYNNVVSSCTQHITKVVFIDTIHHNSVKKC